MEESQVTTSGRRQPDHIRSVGFLINFFYISFQKYISPCRDLRNRYVAQKFLYKPLSYSDALKKTEKKHIKIRYLYFQIIVCVTTVTCCQIPRSDNVTVNISLSENVALFKNFLISQCKMGRQHVKILV